jgi:carboxylesterase
MRPWGEHLIEAGFTVRCPLLPGHGTNWQDMNRTTWSDWYDCVRKELLELLARCDSVFVFGQSMGGTLALRLAQEFGERISGLVLVNPSVMTLRRGAKLLPVLSKLLPSVKGLGGDIAKTGVSEGAYGRVPVRAAASLSKLWRLVRKDLGEITQPMLLLHSKVDHVVEPVNSRIIIENVASRFVTEIVLENSYHVATLDNDAPLIFKQSVEFVIQTHRAAQAGAR